MVAVRDGEFGDDDVPIEGMKKGGLWNCGKTGGGGEFAQKPTRIAEDVSSREESLMRRRSKVVVAGRWVTRLRV